MSDECNHASVLQRADSLCLSLGSMMERFLFFFVLETATLVHIFTTAAYLLKHETLLCYLVYQEASFFCFVLLCLALLSSALFCFALAECYA